MDMHSRLFPREEVETEATFAKDRLGLMAEMIRAMLALGNFGAQR